MEALFFSCMSGIDLLEFDTLFASLVVALNDVQDLLPGIKQIADGTVVVECIDDISKILAHATADIPGAVLQFGFLINEIGGDDLVDDAIFIGFVEFLDAVCEQAKGLADEYSFRFALFELSRHFDDAVAGRKHVVDHDHVLAFYAGAQEFMGNNRVLAVDDLCVIAALVEHTHIKPQDVGVVDGTLHATLVRADDS